MQEFFSLLDIKKEIFIGSELGLEKSKTELLADICSKTNADTYLSGEGAKQYFQPELFEKNNLSHLFNEYKHSTLNFIEFVF